jgi:uncharacterized protein YndB with AHSA1/START domain
VIETEIARPPAEVFAYAIDPSQLPVWQKNIVSAAQEGDGPLDVGVRLREVHRIGGKEVQTLAEISEFEQDRMFALRTLEGPMSLHAKVTFEPTGDGTLMTFTAQGQPGGILRLAGPFLQSTIKHRLTEDCATLKQILEGTAPDS